LLSVNYNSTSNTPPDKKQTILKLLPPKLQESERKPFEIKTILVKMYFLSIFSFITSLYRTWILSFMLLKIKHKPNF